MASNENNIQSIFPDMPREIPAVDKEGNFSFIWSLGFASLFQALQRNFKNEGILFPPLTTDEANVIVANYSVYIGDPLPPGVDDISGQTIYNKTISAPQIFIISYIGSNVSAVKWWTFTIT